MEKEKKEILKNNKLALSIVFVIAIAILLVGVSYAYFSANSTTTAQTITTDNVSINFASGSILRANNLMPINSDEVLTKATEFPFSITNNGSHTEQIRYQINILSIDEALANEDFRWDLYAGNTKIESGNFQLDMSYDNWNINATIDMHTIVKYLSNETKNYKLYIYILNSGEPQNHMQGKTMEAKISALIVPTTYKVTTLSNGKDGITISNGVLGGMYTGNAVNIVIPEGITSIGDETLPRYNWRAIETVTIPSSVTTIGMYAFYRSNLTSVTLPNNLTSIGDSAFEDNNLTSVVIPSNVTSIGESAFYDHHITTIRNTTGRNFDWKSILCNMITTCTKTTGTSNDSFITGTCTVYSDPDLITPVRTVTITE